MADFSNLRARAEADFGRLARRVVDQQDEAKAVQACLGLALRSACHYHATEEHVLSTAQRIGGHLNPVGFDDWVRMFPTTNETFKLLVSVSPSCGSRLAGDEAQRNVYTSFMYAMAGLEPGILPAFYTKWLFGPVYNELKTYRVMVNHIGPCLTRAINAMKPSLKYKSYSKLGQSWRSFVEHRNESWKKIVSECFVPVSPTREEEIQSAATPRERAPRRATLALPGTLQAQLFVPGGEVRTLIGPVGAPVMITPVGPNSRVEVDVVTRESNGTRFYFVSPAAVIPVAELYASANPIVHRQRMSAREAGEEGAVAVLLGEGLEQPTTRPEHLHPEPEPNRSLVSVQADEAYRLLAQVEAAIWQAAHEKAKATRATTMREIRRLYGLVAPLDSGAMDPNNPLTYMHGSSLTYIHPVSYRPAGSTTESAWQGSSAGRANGTASLSSGRSVREREQQRHNSSNVGASAAVAITRGAASTQRRLEAASDALRERIALEKERSDQLRQRAGGEHEGKSDSSSEAMTTPSPVEPLSPVQLRAAYERERSRSPSLFQLMHAVEAAHDEATAGQSSAGNAGVQEQQQISTPDTLFPFPPSPLLNASPGPSGAFVASTTVNPEEFLLPQGIPCVQGKFTKGRGNFKECVGPESSFTSVGACAECLVSALETAKANEMTFEEGFFNLMDTDEVNEEDDILKNEVRLVEVKRAMRAIGSALYEQEVLSVRLQLLAEAKAPPTAYLARALDLQIELLRALTVYAADAVQGNDLERHELIPKGLTERQRTFKRTLEQLYENDGCSRHPFNEEGTGGQLKSVEGDGAACVQYAGTTSEPVMLTYSPPSSPSEAPSDLSSSDETQEPDAKRQRLEAAEMG